MAIDLARPGNNDHVSAENNSRWQLWTLHRAGNLSVPQDLSPDASKLSKQGNHTLCTALRRLYSIRSRCGSAGSQQPNRPLER